MLRPEPGEKLNTVTHALGFVLSLIAAGWLMIGVVEKGESWRVASCGIYAVMLVSVYGFSTLSHSVVAPNWKRFFRILDQAFIYLLIVGTYTPFAVRFLNFGYWPFFLGLLWLIALVGFFSKLFFAHRIDGVAIWIYVVLGWLHVFAAFPLLEFVPVEALWWMLYGGICYTIGTLFLVNDHRVHYFHGIWHLFVIAGSAWQFFAIMRFVALA